MKDATDLVTHDILDAAPAAAPAPARGRKPLAAQVAAEPAFDQGAIDAADLALREQAQQDQLELLELAADVGALRMADMMRNLVAAATVRLFDKIRESKQIKHLPIRQPDGTVATATTVDEFCRLAFGKPRTAMIEASETLQALGEQAYETAARLGLNRNALRAVRALPPAQQEQVRAAIEEGAAKAEVLTVIEDLAEKVQRAEEQLADVRAERAADQKLLEAKGKQIDRLHNKIARFDAAAPDEQLADLKRRATAVAGDAEGLVLGALRQALAALAQHAQAHGDARALHGVYMAGLVGQVQARLTALRDEFDLPDVSGAAAAELAAEVAQWAN